MTYYCINASQDMVVESGLESRELLGRIPGLDNFYQYSPAMGFIPLSVMSITPTMIVGESTQ